MLLEIREAGMSDRRDIQRLLSFYFLDTDDVEKNLPGFIVAVFNREIAGCAGLYMNEVAELGAIAILPQCRNQGIGSALLDAVMKQAAKTAEFLYLRTTNPAFFMKKGFTVLQGAEKKNVWGECVTCDKYQDCRQVFMKINLRKKAHSVKLVL